ncbi:glycerol dehydrogenase [Corynebacterium liangguodongii]|uniref:Glycerol dehydrogenase n=1 Tax=Corynebacterium liangguodongii TaxID=2079535 RepID=A0A2S0WCT7_9CORY|nr:glycerol dehydrogenase [Corynebacterium liangguodongii]AWB83581.1 glycerol dehydrogenase [Corynebacterium liangguodongii]PWB98627.1 glycerol dehydrogenase [Corynebacterium liangguodongii]
MDVKSWIIAIAGAVIGAMFFGWLLSMLGVSGILYTVLVLIGSAVTSSLAGMLFRPR